MMNVILYFLYILELHSVGVGMEFRTRLVIRYKGLILEETYQVYISVVKF